MNYKNDAEIKNEVLFQLGWDTRVKQTEVGVTVKKGVVTLTGKVDSYAKKMAAQRAAHRVTGVLDVANDIEVKVPDELHRSDAEIALAARHALEWDVLVPSDKIHTTVTDGWITLEGSVEFYRERVDAEKAISHLAGVRGVTNRIQICTNVDPERVKYLIEDVLERRADREANKIDVKSENGVVTLTGTVNSWDEKRAIIGAVSHAPGVRIVNDRLIIDPYKLHMETAV